MKEKAVEVISLAVYPDGSSALKDVRFLSIYRGEAWAIVGPTKPGNPPLFFTDTEFSGDRESCESTEKK